MVLYKATRDGNVEMSKSEEDQVRADWAEGEREANKPKPKTLDDIIRDHEARISALEKGGK